LVDVFVPGEEVSFIISQCIIMLAFTSYYFYVNYVSMKKMMGAVFTLTLFFLLINLLVPLLHGSSIKTNLIDTSRTLSSFAILPIAFHYYATKGLLVNLYKKALDFSYVLVGTILIFTFLKIDSNYFNDSGRTWMSAEELGNILYFGIFVFAVDLHTLDF
jgi:DMSO/TMAO reductase YedYZ heme-binding membrane subunit